MSLVTWNGKLLLSPGGKLTLGPAADECCCVEDDGPCDCDCPNMPASLSVLGCVFAFTDSVDEPAVKCAFSYRTPDPDPCFDGTYQVNELILECSHTTPDAHWFLQVLGNYELGSLGGRLKLPAGGCPPPGTYDVDMLDNEFPPNIVVTLEVTIP